MKSDLALYRSNTLQALKRFVVLTLTLPVLMVLASAILVGAIGSLAGQSGIEIAVAFIGDATVPVMMSLLKFVLPTYFFIAAIYFAFSWDCWTGTHLRQLTARFQSKIIGLARLWASMLSNVATLLYATGASRRQVTHQSFAAGTSTPYLAGEAPQLE